MEEKVKRGVGVQKMRIVERYDHEPEIELKMVHKAVMNGGFCEVVHHLPHPMTMNLGWKQSLQKIEMQMTEMKKTSEMKQSEKIEWFEISPCWDLSTFLAFLSLVWWQFQSQKDFFLSWFCYENLGDVLWLEF